VRPVSVVVGGVEAEHVLEMAAVDDQNPVEALAAEGADPTLGIGVRVWGSDGRADDLYILTAEDVIESATEFAIAIVEQEPERLLLVGEEHQQVSRLLCRPSARRLNKRGRKQRFRRRLMPERGLTAPCAMQVVRADPAGSVSCDS
jgi:hypothetical protein